MQRGAGGNIACLRSEEHAGEVGVNDCLPGVQLHAHHKRVFCDARIVHKNINGAPFLYCLIYQSARRGAKLFSTSLTAVIPSEAIQRAFNGLVETLRRHHVRLAIRSSELERGRDCKALSLKVIGFVEPAYFWMSGPLERSA